VLEKEEKKYPDKYEDDEEDFFHNSNGVTEESE
jgi:hypothetical protein